MIFISYSHEDEEFFQEFEKHLKPWQELAAWSDRDIVASKNWHAEIQDAIGRSQIAVLLTSNNFLNSEFIREHELRPLYRAERRGEIAVTALHLRLSDIHSFRFDVDGQRRSIIELQGLNDPATPVNSVEGHKRDVIYLEAVRQLKELMANLGATRPNLEPATSASLTPRSNRPLRRHELTVHLEVVDNFLHRRFSNGFEKVAASPRCDWPPLRQSLQKALGRGLGESNAVLIGDKLYETLLGDESLQQKVLRGVFQSEAPGSRSPLRDPVRVRIISNDSLLIGLPWTLTSRRGRALRDQGWTFEQTLVEFEESHQLPQGFLKAPGPVLVAASPEDLRYKSFAGAAFRCLDQAWSSAYPRLKAAGLEEIRESSAKRNVSIFIYFGSAFRARGQLALLLRSEKGGERPTTLGELTQALGKQLPRLMMLALIESAPAPPGEALKLLTSAGSAVIAFSSLDPRSAADQSLIWLRQFLEGGEYADPVVFAHEHLPSTTTAYAGYGDWINRTVDAGARQELARLMLDRKRQRGHARLLVDELAYDQYRRLCCGLIYGSPGNHPEKATEQIFEYLRKYGRGLVAITRERLELPEQIQFTAATVEKAMRRHLQLGPREDLGAVVCTLRPERVGESVPMLMLDWGARGGSRHGKIAISSIRSWLEFNRNLLLPQCLRRDPHLRLLSILSLELAKEAHRDLEKRVKQMQSEDDLIDRAFRLELLDPLEDVEQEDLVAYLDTRKDCPDDLHRSLPPLIMQATQGRFDLTCDWLEKCASTDWYLVNDELQARVGQGSGNGGSVDEDKVL